ncbi:MAG: phage tail protein, partial [Pyrinomonadaceae bacterium]|nr:phage tail protein [Pyrinomonadaceae bacterium]
MASPFIGEILGFGGNFAPRGWAFCQGQLLSIASNTALFSILGTTYGGDGRVTFALPDLRGRAAVSQGTGPGLSPYPLGSRGGQERHTLITNELPSHNHLMRIRKEKGSVSNPSGATLATSNDPNVNIYTTLADDSTLANGSITNTGGSQSHNNLQPYLTINFIIA